MRALLTATVALLTIVAMTLAGFSRIAVDPAVCGGRSTAAGTRLRVNDVLEMLAGGASETEIAADFPYVTVADVRTCLATRRASPITPLFSRLNEIPR